MIEGLSGYLMSGYVFTNNRQQGVEILFEIHNLCSIQNVSS